MVDALTLEQFKKVVEEARTRGYDTVEVDIDALQALIEGQLQSALPSPSGEGSALQASGFVLVPRRDPRSDAPASYRPPIPLDAILFGTGALGDALRHPERFRYANTPAGAFDRDDLGNEVARIFFGMLDRIAASQGETK